MKVGVAKESDPGETRVAVVPDTARRLADDGVEVLVERGAGETAAFADTAYEEAGARLVAAERALRSRPTSSARCGRPSPTRSDACATGQVLIALLQPLVDRRAEPRAGRARRHRLLPGLDPARDPRPADGRALLAEHGRRLQGGHPRRRAPRQVLPDADDRRRARSRPRRCSCSARASPGCRRSQPPAGSAPSSRPSTCARSSRSRWRAWARPSSSSTSKGAEGMGGYAVALSEDQHVREQQLIAHHAAGSDAVITTALVPGRPAPELITEEAVRGMRHGLRDRRPRRRGRRQLRGDRARQDGRRRRRHHRRPDEPAGDDARPREPDVLAERPGLPRPDRRRGRAHGSTSRTRSCARPASRTAARSCGSPLA